MSILPHDVIDLIADTCSDDISTLKSISLVSSAWLISTRTHLFNTVSLQVHRIDELLEIAHQPKSTLTRFVKRMEIDGVAFRYEPSCGDLGSIRQLGAILPCVSALRLSNLDLEDIAVQFADAIHMAFPGVVELELEGMTFTFVTHAITLLCRFRSLERVTMQNLAWMDPAQSEADASTVPASKFPSTLVEMKLDACYKRDIMACLLSQNPLPTIQKLDLGLVSPEDCQSYGEYLKRLGPDLSSLAMEFRSLDPGGDAEDFFNACDLSYNTRLRSISFRRVIFDWEYRLTSPMSWIAKTLSQISSSQFETPIFGIHLSDLNVDIDRESLHDWQSLDTGIVEMHRRLPAFQSAVFEMHLLSDVSETIPLHASKIFLDSLLPLSGSQNILEPRNLTV
ncbi:hypothetical protein PQX77_013139 [Marasmius sp. AFHP31]|nr:hypothetical protein PQX77_013139 [Marasmius sp. AFHP31]